MTLPNDRLLLQAKRLSEGE